METIKFSDFPELINPNLKLKDAKMIIQDKTDIEEDNQRFHIYFDFFDFYGWESYLKTHFGIFLKSKYMIHQDILLKYQKNFMIQK